MRKTWQCFRFFKTPFLWLSGILYLNFVSDPRGQRSLSTKVISGSRQYRNWRICRFWKNQANCGRPWPDWSRRRLVGGHKEVASEWQAIFENEIPWTLPTRREHMLLPLCQVCPQWHQWCILRDPGADSGGERKSKWAGKYGTKKSKERREEPLGTMSYQTSSKLSRSFWLLIGARKLLCFSAQSIRRQNGDDRLELVW